MFGTQNDQCIDRTNVDMFY